MTHILLRFPSRRLLERLQRTVNLNEQGIPCKGATPAATKGLRQPGSGTSRDEFLPGGTA